jgi:uncharacterized protein (TIGR03084 family)
MSRPDPAVLLADLREEGRQLETLLAQLAAQDWDRPTPASGWTVRHQVAHLAWTDRLLLTALEDPSAFDGERTLLAGAPDLVDRAAHDGAARPPSELLVAWQGGRQRVLEALAAVPDGGRIPWIGPPMGTAMMASARIMETWAHGQDIRDTVDRPTVVSHRLRHIAHLAVAARDFAFRAHGHRPPAEPFRVEIVHGDERWTWGPPESAQRVRGSSSDFALLATRRRHRQDCDVTAEGMEADRWLDLVQAYAGPPGTGRPAAGGQRRAVQQGAVVTDSGMGPAAP